VTIVEDDSKIWETNLSRSESTFEGQEIIQLRHNDVALSFIVMKYKVGRLSPEPKREAVSESNILLAFPLNENQEPKLDFQHVYAFLPIREYGFEVSPSLFVCLLSGLFHAKQRKVSPSGRFSPYRESLGR
jgi:hypothetical protein